MNILEAVVLGVVQGIAEWLPISSEAVITLILTQALGVDPAQALNASIFLHIGTMTAALVYFRDEYVEIAQYCLNQVQEPTKALNEPTQIFHDESGRITIFLILSTLITGIVGGVIYFTGIKTAIQNPQIFYIIMSSALFLTGILRLYRRNEDRTVDSINFRDSIFVGFLQGFSIIPGISRSGTTAFGFLFKDFDAKSAFHLSFLMSVPAVAAGSIGLELFTEFTFQGIYIVSAFVAGVTGYLTIGMVLDVADRAEISWICFALGILALMPLFI